jgi:DNA-binding NarL/FixJ family response regulator
MIKVLIVDDQKTVQEIIKNYIEADHGLELVACANDGKEAIELIDIHHPDVVLMDIEMPIMDGLKATQIISEQFINTNVLIISVHNDDTYLDAALQVGAKGYLKKNTPEKELVHAVYSAYKGYFQLGPGLLEQYLYKATKSQSNSQEIEQLKSVILQQSKLLDNLNTGRGNQRKNADENGVKGNENSKFALENRCANLEKQVYHISNHLDKLNKKAMLNQQLSVLVILSCAFVVIGLLLSMLMEF